MKRVPPSLLTNFVKRSLLLLVTGIFSMLALSANATSFPVTNTNDAGPGSLRQAIINANAAPGGNHSIAFNVYGQIVVQSSLPTITSKGLTIDGLSKITLNTTGGDVSIAFFTISADSVNIRNMTLLNTGYIDFYLPVATTGVTIRNILTNNTNGSLMDNIVYVAAASTNLTLKNIISRTGIQGCNGITIGRPFYFAAGTHTNLVMDSIRLSSAGNNTGCEAIVFRDASINGFRFTNSNFSGFQDGVAMDNTGGPVETANNVLFDHIIVDSMYGNGVGTALYSDFVNTGFTIKNSVFDLDNVATPTPAGDDNDYAIRFDNSVTGLLADSVTIHDAEVYAMLFNNTDTSITLKHITIDNFDGYTANQGIRFAGTVNGLTMVNVNINEDVTGTTDDGDYGLLFSGAASNVSIDSLTINEADVDGISVSAAATNFSVNHSKFTVNTHGMEFYNAAHSGISILNSSFYNGSQGIAINTTNATQQFTIQGDTIANNTSHGIVASSGTVATSISISNNVIHDNGGYGVYMNSSPTNVNITNNAIYNNKAQGIFMDGTGNCGYIGATKSPAILSSTPLGGGKYTLMISVPTVSAGATYSIDIYANDAGTTATSGQYYVTTLTNMPAGNTSQNVTFNSGPGATGTGFWTATLRIPANVCGTSAFGAPFPMTVQGPAGISNGVVAWYRADVPGSVTTNWADISGNANNMTASGTPITTNGLVNFNPAFYYNGSSTHAAPSTAAVTTSYTLGGMGVLEGTQNSSVFATSTGDKLFGWYGGLENRLYLQAWWDNGNNITNYAHLYSTKRVNTPASFEFRGDGVSLLSGNNPDGTAWTLTTGGGLGFNSKVYVPEAYIFNRDLTAAEMQRLESYMALKYGITLGKGLTDYVATDGSVYWTAANHATFVRRITGIGRDSITMLYQKQSLSLDTGTVTIALGSKIDSSNVLNTSAISKNKSFLVFADNNASMGMVRSFAGVKATARMSRLWTVEKTNWTDQLITLRFTSGSPSNYLLISTDSSFATASQQLRLKADGSVTLNSSLLANGVYFTLGADITGPAKVNSGIALWLRADDGTATGTQWNDYSGNLNFATQKAATSRPLPVSNAFNYNRGLRFDGIDDFLTVPYNPAYNGDVTVYTVYRQTAGSSYRSLIANFGATTTTGWGYYLSGDGRQWYTGYSSAWDIYTDGNYTVKVPEMAGLTATLANGTSTKNVYINGIPALQSPPANRRYVANPASPLYIGGTVFNNYYWNGDIAEEVVYSRVLAATERRQVESYLALKYGITLHSPGYLASDSNLVYWDSARNTGYTSHIFGLGRDTSTSLYQKQALGIDSGYIAVALGTKLANTNDSNTAVITTDKSFLVFGDNGRAKTFSNPMTTAGATLLTMPRIWKVQKTAWTDQTITLVAADTTLGMPQDLVISTDAAFGAGDLVLPMINGKVALNSSQLPDGAFFTFADTVRGPGGVSAGIGAWWRADIGASGAAWTDYSGNGKLQAQPAASAQPTLQPSTANFNPAFNFNGSNLMSSPSLFGTGNTNNVTVFAVLLPQLSDGFFGELTSNGNQVRGYAPFADGQVYFDAPYNNRINAPWGGTAGNRYMFTFTRFPTGTTMDISLNNKSLVSSTTNFTNVLGNNSPFYLGSYTSTGIYKGQMAEVVVYTNNANMLSADRQKIQSYLAFKYGITMNPLAPVDYLASDGTVFWGSAANSAYPRHITGIGRDSVSALYQKQSVSADTGWVTIALGNSIDSANIANANSIGNDKSFFVFSDNGGSTLFTTPMTGAAAVNVRMTRVFRVQKTNWADQVITLKGSGASSQTYLLVSADPAFATGVTSYPFVDSVIHLNTSALANASYFTFGTRLKGPAAVSKGIVMWLRADDSTASGQVWNDHSNNGGTATQTTVTGQPAMDATGINFNYALKFNGSNSFSLPALYNSTDSLAAFFVSFPSSFNTSYAALAEFGNDEPGMYWRSASANLYTDKVTTPDMLHAYKYPTPRPALFLYATNNSNPKNFVVGADGIHQTFTSAVGTYPINGGAAGARLGGINVGSGSEINFNGYLGEAIFYRRNNLTATEIQRIESYLALKYGITLDSGQVNYIASDSSVYWTAAANANYPRHITGIGRDDSTALYTKQSISADSGLVTLALGTGVPLTNQLNTNTIAKDKSFFVFSDNGRIVGNFTAPVSGSAHKVTLRYARVWKVQKTNWTDQTITLKVRPLGVENYLLVSTDSTFSTLNQELLVNPDSTVTLNSSLLTNGIYFSFGASLKSPGGVSGHALWLRADIGAGTADSAGVSQWTDLSAFGNSPSQAMATSQPRYRDNTIDNINFNPVVRFNGGTNNLSGSSMLKTGTYRGAAAFVVNSQVTANNTSVFLEGSDGGQFNMHATWGDNTLYWDAPQTSNRITYNAGNVNGQIQMWTGTSNIDLTANRQTIFKNGTSVASGNNVSLLTGTNSPYFIGNFGTTGLGFNGRIPEVVIYTSALTPIQQQMVHSYLSLKYGITFNGGKSDYLPTDSTLKIWDAAANATYKNDIAGIGRDDAESLEQKESRSINAGIQPVIGLGEIDSTNSANSNNFAADKSYLIWGDDSATTAFLTAVTGNPTVNSRMTRVWKVQETGTVGSIQIAIPFTALPNTANANLIVSADNTFDGSDQFYPLTQIVMINGVKHYAVTVNLTNGQFFTFGTTVKAPGGVGGTTLWLRADQGIAANTDSALVDNWVDYGNQVNTVSQTVVAKQPLFRNSSKEDINFNPVLRFNGNATLSGASMLKTSTYTGSAAFVVNSLATSSGGSSAFLEGTTSQYFNMEVPHAAGNAVWSTPYNTTTVFFSPGNLTNLVSLWTGSNNTTIPSNRQAFYKNGVIGVTGNSAVAMVGTNSPVVIAGYSAGGPGYNGRIPEEIIYTRALSTNQTQQVNSYLAVKYGITLNNGATDYLSTDSTVKIWDATANSLYKNGITGIGRDDIEGLIQRQSRNSDTTRMRIVVGLGEIDSTNSSNTNDFTADKSYLLWGDDNGSQTFQTPITGNPSANFRMGRTWRVQETGTVGSVEVAFSYDLLPNPDQSFLIVSNDAVFDATDTYVPLYNITVSGKNHWAARVDFNNGQYFTIASFIKSPGGVGMTSLWLRPDKGIVNNTDGSAMDTWVDYANQVNNASQSNILNQPAFRNNATDNVNFNPVVKFSNPNSTIMNLDISKLPIGSNARTMFAMGRMTLVPAAFMISWGTEANNQYSALGYDGSGTGSAFFSGFNNDITASNIGWPANTFSELSFTWAGNGGPASLRSRMKQVAASANLTLNTGTTGAAIGASFANKVHMDGVVGDYIVFNRMLSANELSRVETYLGIRYGYTLDQTTPNNYLNTNSTPVWDATANQLYKYNIAGVGRDDIEGLDQRQSRSINSGSIVAIGLGDLASDNPSNTTSFTSDTSYLIWGSDSAVLTTMATNLPAGTLNAERMVQQWKVDASNFSNQQQPVTMRFDLNGFSYSDTGLNNLVLLIDADGDGDFTTGTVQKVPASAFDGAAKTATFSNITTLTNGAVFTLLFQKNILQLNAKVYLQGAWDATTSTMRTDLKTQSLLPATDPYGLNTTPSVNPNNSTAAVVDWVRVELRDPVTPTTVVASRAALLLADGSIVDTNYLQPLSFLVPTGQYNVVIRHRNHLGILTATPVDFSSGAATLNFTDGTTATYARTNVAQTDLGNGVFALWGGDANGDGKVNYSGSGSDPDWILVNPMGGSYNGYLNAYNNGDVNLDGQVYYISTGNDSDWILYLPLQGDPGNLIEAQLP